MAGIRHVAIDENRLEPCAREPEPKLATTAWVGSDHVR